MKKVLSTIILTIALVGVQSQLQAIQPFIDQSSTPLGLFNWGDDYWSPNHEYRYAEARLFLDFTINLYHPTNLNIVGAYSQVNYTCDVDVYIATTSICHHNDRDPHAHGGWWNSAIKDGGYYVGRCHFIGTPEMFSFDVDSWIRNNPSLNYYVVLDQLDDPSDAVAYQVWLGPPGRLIQDVEEIPEKTPLLSQRPTKSFPNPAKSTATISYTLDKRAVVTVKIYNQLGQAVRTLTKDSAEEAGEHSIQWNGRDDTDKTVSSGTYFWEIKTPDRIITGKTVITK